MCNYINCQLTLLNNVWLKIEESFIQLLEHLKKEKIDIIIVNTETKIF